MQLVDNLELVSALLMPVVHEFRLMQQQMLEHFDRSMDLMSRMFEMSQQQRQNSREEERQCLQQLEDELQDLRRKLAARSSEPPLQLPRARPPMPGTGSAAPASANDTADAMHLVLHDRIAALKNGQSGRLHKVIQSLLGR